MKKILRALTIAALAGTLAACGGDSDQATTADPSRSISAEAEAFYAANPDFFTFATPAEIPADLEWQNGGHLPDVGSPEATKGGTQYEYTSDFPATLRTVGPDANGEFRRFILDFTAIPLAPIHPDHFDVHPGIASEWAMGEDGKTVYARLNPAARFTDGEAITTDDFVFSFFFHQTDYIVAPWYNNYYSTKFTNITKYDDHTLSITMADAKPDVLFTVLSMTPVPQHFFNELGEDYVERYQWRFVPHAGAYEIRPENVTMGTNLVMTRVQDWWAKDLKYWQNRFNPDRINFIVIRDTAKVFEAFRRGDIDNFKIRTADYWYENLPNNDPDVAKGYIQKYEFYNDGPRSNWGLWINTARAPLDNLDVRIGIQYASNFDVVMANYFRGDYVRLENGQVGYGEFSNEAVNARPFNIARAEEHFAKAGYTRRGPDGILVKADGQRLSVTLSTHYERYQDVFTILKEEAAKAGLEFRLEMLDTAAGSRKVSEKQHDIYFIGFNVGLELYPRYWDFYHSDNAYDDAFLDDGSVNPDRQVKVQTNNIMSFADFEMDQLIERYDSSSDKDEMVELAHRLTQLAHDHGSFVPGFVEPFYRHASWRWVRWPDDFNERYSKYAEDYFVHWIDQEMKQETLAARRSGQSFEARVEVYDQYRQQ